MRFYGNRLNFRTALGPKLVRLFWEIHIKFSGETNFRTSQNPLSAVLKLSRLLIAVVYVG